jgi:RimJ/RimL family protein N-acetyltransferase
MPLNSVVRPKREVVRIRNVITQDAERFVVFRQRLFGETNFLLYGPGEYLLTAEDVSSQIERASQVPTHRNLIAEDDEGFVGFLSIIGSSVPRVRHSAHLALGVLRSAWGRGVATDLLNEALRWAPTVGLSRLELSVMTTNTRAIALYEHLGFKFEGLRRHAYIINGKSVDDHLMGYVFEA